MQIFVRVGFSWRTVCWDVEPSTTIHDIKEIIYDREGIPPIQLIVIWKGKRVDGIQTVSELNIIVKIKFSMHLVVN